VPPGLQGRSSEAVTAHDPKDLDKALQETVKEM